MQDKELAELASHLAELTLRGRDWERSEREAIAEEILQHLRVEPYFKAEKGGE